MKLTEVRCKRCGKTVLKKKSTAKFCGDDCRRLYWSHHVEPRAVCEDCGTRLGVSSLKNIRARSQKSLCRSCAGYRRNGVGRDI